MEKAYKERQAECGLKVEDKVRVLRKAEDCEDGWGNTWAKVYMDDFVGRIGKIVGERPHAGFKVFLEEENDWWYFPYFVLEKVDEEQKETPKAEGSREGFFKLTFHFTNGEVLSFVGKKDEKLETLFVDEDGSWYAFNSDNTNYVKSEKI